MLASYIKHNPDIVAKFWAQVDRSGGPDACWPWLGKKTKEDARGYCWFCGRSMKTSRVAWILTYKKEPKNWALHCCPTGSNGNCCNPTHLYDGTAKQNTADCIREGRYKNGSTLHPETRARGARHGSKTHPDRVAKGERAGSAKLSNWDVMGN